MRGARCPHRRRGHGRVRRTVSEKSQSIGRGRQVPGQDLAVPGAQIADPGHLGPHDLAPFSQHPALVLVLGGVGQGAERRGGRQPELPGGHGHQLFAATADHVQGLHRLFEFDAVAGQEPGLTGHQHQLLLFEFEGEVLERLALLE